MGLREEGVADWDSLEEDESSEEGEPPHMQEAPRLREEAADFAWDVAPLEQLRGLFRQSLQGRLTEGVNPPIICSLCMGVCR